MALSVFFAFAVHYPQIWLSPIFPAGPAFLGAFIDTVFLEVVGKGNTLQNILFLYHCFYFGVVFSPLLVRGGKRKSAAFLLVALLLALNGILALLLLSGAVQLPGHH